MTEPSNLLASDWQNFYVIVGSSSAALIGLQFVVLTLIAERRAPNTSTHGLGAFTTPTVVHFAGALLISAIMTTPWPSIGAAGIALGICGLVGLIYSARVGVLAARPTGYDPVLADWIWYVSLPLLADVGLAVGGWLVYRHAPAGPFLAAAAALSLLGIGIHNAWDTVVYVVVHGVPGA